MDSQSILLPGGRASQFRHFAAIRAGNFGCAESQEACRSPASAHCFEQQIGEFFFHLEPRSLDMPTMALLSPAAGATRRVSSPFTSNRSTSTPMVRLQPAGAWRIVLQQQRQQAQAGRGAFLCRAEGGDGEQKQSGDEQPPSSSSSSSSPGEAPKRPPVADPAVAKGQLTAIITGAISIAFGVSL